MSRASTFFPSIALDDAPRHRGTLLFLVSVAALYIEVLLIRWVGTEFRLFAYFQNLALLATFLGFGVGCLESSKKPSQLFELWPLCALALFIDFPWKYWKRVLEIIGAGMSVSSDAQMWQGYVPGFNHWLGLLIGAPFVAAVLLCIVMVMKWLGNWVGRLMESSEQPIQAYSLNLLGSLAGVWLFAGVSFMRLPPACWVGLAFVIFILVQPSGKRIQRSAWAGMAACLVLLIIGGFPDGKTFWTPYQKLEVVPLADENYQINVNNTGYMSIANMTPAYLDAHPAVRNEYQQGSSYDSPYRFIEHTGDVLVVGSGAGNDVAAALRHGAEHIDAVEIDPVIYGIGRKLHPEKPYENSKVHVEIDDARDFMRRTQNRYDVIVFGLLDSHTLSSNFSNMRIDNYVYTKESFAEAKRLLKPSGVLVLKFEVRAPHTWMGERFYSTLNSVFGHAPLMFYSPAVQALFSATVFLESKDSALWQRASSAELAQFISSHPLPYSLNSGSTVATTTDDWPYIYQRDHSIPNIYLTVSIILLGIAFLLVRPTLRYREASMWQFFLLGGGFLLLETQLVSRLPLYFGSTWLVNCIALTFVLLVLVAANVFATRVQPASLWPYYALLLAGLLAAYAIHWSELPFVPRTIGLLLAAGYSVPLFFAGVIFAESFRRAGGRANVFGANILGAVAGGLAQNLSFVTGLKSLLLVAAIFYVGAAAAPLFERKGLTLEAGASTD